MSDIKLMPLTEIARELGVNYKTLLSCKYRFSQYALGVQVGRITKYSSELVDFFMLVFALYDEGYTSEKIHELLKEGMISENDAFIKGWIDDWREKFSMKKISWQTSSSDAFLAPKWTDGLTDRRTDGLTDRRADSPIGSPTDLRTELPTDSPSDSLGDGPTDLPTDSPTDGPADRPADRPADGMNESTSEPLNNPGDLNELRARLKEEIREEFLPEITRAVREESSQVVSLVKENLDGMRKEVNSAFSLVAKAVHELYNELLAIETRLRKLEDDLLGEGEGEPIQLDIPDLNISITALYEESDQEKKPLFDIDFIRASIQNGKPDKSTIVSWIHEEREKNPDLTYKDLAEFLNYGRIPTLRGREKWSRSVVRNLAVGR